MNVFALWLATAFCRRLHDSAIRDLSRTVPLLAVMLPDGLSGHRSCFGVNTA